MFKYLSAVVTAVVFVLKISIANAASVSLTPAINSVAQGDVFNVDVVVDFSGDATLGGGIDIFYSSSALDFQGFTFSTATVSLDSAFSRTPDDLAGELEGLAFGNFGGITTGRVGTLTFQALAPGVSAITAAVTSDPLKGGDFYSAQSYDFQSVTFNSAEVQINAVPVPAAVWLFGSGLLGLVGIARRRKIA